MLLRVSATLWCVTRRPSVILLTSLLMPVPMVFCYCHASQHVWWRICVNWLLLLLFCRLFLTRVWNYAPRTHKHMWVIKGKLRPRFYYYYLHVTRSLVFNSLFRILVFYSDRRLACLNRFDPWAKRKQIKFWIVSKLVCAGARVFVCVYALTIVSTDKMVRFIITWMIIYY